MPVRTGSVVFAILLSLFCSSSVHAQAARPGCADSVSRALGHLIGTWDVRAVFRQGPSWDTSTAEVRIHPDFGGCLLRELFVGTRNGQPFNVLSLWGAVGLRAPIQRTFVHSQHGLIGVYSGEVRADALVLRDSQLVNAQMTYFEHRFEPFFGDSMRFASLRSTDRGASWVLTWYADYRRRAS